MYRPRSGKGLRKLRVRMLSEPVSQLDNFDLRLEVPNIFTTYAWIWLELC